MTQAPTQPAARQPEHRYLRIADLRRLRHLFFSSKRVVEGQYAGRHASPQRGHSVEFNDYREYIPGDTLSDVDWKVFGRSDKLFIKLFEHQSDMTVNLLVDASASMAYRGMAALPHAGTSWLNRVSLAASKRQAGDARRAIDLPSKYDHACLMAAAIAFLTTKQQDKVSFTLAREGLARFHRPQGSFTHLNNILRDMETAKLTGEARLADALKDLVRRVSRKGLVVVFSDLLEDQESVLKALAAFTHRGNEVIVFQVLHAEELKLPAVDEAVFVDSETSRRRRLNVADVRASYEQRMRRFIDGWSTALRARNIDHQVVSTATPYHKALERYLFNRASMT
ncbi:MAG: DUF58 domain-containing protein [Phycisphaeraceae bacterium]